MKNVILFAVISLVPLFATAQFRPMVEDGKTWAILANSYFGPQLDEWTGTKTNIIRGDSVVNGVNYKRVYSAWKEDLSDAKINCLARENHGKIYIKEFDPYGDDDISEYLYFDQNAEVGDTLIISAFDFECIVLAIDTVTLSGSSVPLKRFATDMGTFYEGIGFPAFGLAPETFDPPIGGSFTLICCHEGDGTPLYVMHCDSGKLKPVSGLCYFDASMLEGIDVTPSEPSGSTHKIYTIDGRELQSKPKRGVFIENGQKKVAE